MPLARTLLLTILGLSALAAITRPVNAQFAQPATDSALSIPPASQVEPSELAKMLTGTGQRPLIFQVGSHMLFQQAHIAGSEYVGPGSQQAGLDALKARVASLKHDTPIVLYCGCCPWVRCPNMGPAFSLLRQMGFTRVRALHIETNLGADWAAKGYPTERGQ